MEDKFNFNHFSSFTVDSKTRDISQLGNFLNELNNNEKTVERKLNIGDRVRLKGRNYVVVVEYINYEMPGIGRVDYAGTREDGKEENLLCIFNQSEIERVIFSNENDLEGKER